MNREEVEEMLAQCKQAGASVETVCTLRLAALSRAWLAMDKSVPGIITTAGTDPETGQPRLIIKTTEAALSDAPALIYKRVRVVVEDSHG